MFEAIQMAHAENQKQVALINQMVAEIGKEKFDYPHADFNQELFDDIVANYMDEAKAAMDTQPGADHSVPAGFPDVLVIGVHSGFRFVHIIGDDIIEQLLVNVVSTGKKVVMIEAGANEIPNDTMFEAIQMAHAENQKQVALINQMTWVWPRVNRPEPWTRGSTLTSAPRGRISFFCRPSTRWPSRSQALTIFFWNL